MLIQSISYSFIDRDMFIRHFSHGVGHLQCEWQHEIKPNYDNSMVLKDDISDSTDNINTRDPNPEDFEIGHDSDEDELPVMVERIDNKGGDWGSDSKGDVSEFFSDSDCNALDCNSYTSY